jgi:hypothetical protein
MSPDATGDWKHLAEQAKHRNEFGEVVGAC